MNPIVITYVPGSEIPVEASPTRRIRTTVTADLTVIGDAHGSQITARALTRVATDPDVVHGREPEVGTTPEGADVFHQVFDVPDGDHIHITHVTVDVIVTQLDEAEDEGA